MKIRVKMALIYAGGFLLLAALLLFAVNVLTQWGINEALGELIMVSDGPDSGRPSVHLSEISREELLRWSAACLAVTTVLAGLLGWWAAGRVLRPVEIMTRTARDISSRNLHERIALTGPDDELKRLADTVDDLLSRLDTAFDSQRRFTANVSHELKTPLALDRATLQIGLEDASDPQLRKMTEQLLGSNRHQQRLIDGLLTLAISERGLDRSSPVDLSDLVGEVVAAHRTRDVTIETSLTPVTVLGDDALLRQLLNNVIDNAVSYNKPDGRVWIGLSPDRLSIRNTGDPVELSRLFEPFDRAGRPRTNEGGHTGLGLSIAHAIATAHGLGMTAHPNPGGGLIILIELRPDPADG